MEFLALLITDLIIYISNSANISLTWSSVKIHNVHMCNTHGLVSCIRTDRKTGAQEVSKQIFIIMYLLVHYIDLGNEQSFVWRV